MKINIRLWKWLFHHSSNTKLYKIVPDLLGMQSICSDGNHVLFLDFDNRSLFSVVDSCKYIQEFHDLGTIYIFKSSKRNFHAVCLDKMTWGQCADINLKMGMKKYMQFSALRGFWVLRVSPKKEHIKHCATLVKWTDRKSSNAHYVFLRKIFGIESPNNLDASLKIKVDIYNSVNK